MKTVRAKAKRGRECEPGWISCSGKAPCPRHAEWWKEFHASAPKAPAEQPFVTVRHGKLTPAQKKRNMQQSLRHAEGRK